MVKRHYVITTGTEVGVFFDHWSNIAHLVKNRSGAVWQGAASQDEAEELFQQASLRGSVRVLPSDQHRSPTNSSSSRASSTRSTQKISGNSSSEATKLQSSRLASAPKIAGSQSEGHRWNNASHYVPAKSNSREMNTDYWPSNGAIRSSHNSGSGGTRHSKPLSRTQSEPSQQMSNTSSVRGNASLGRVASVSVSGAVTRPSISSNNVQTRVRRAVIVDSPPWLASYPDEDDEAFITPPLSPITSPTVSSGLLGPSKSKSASTFAASLNLAADMDMLGSRSETALDSRSPKPAKPSTSFSFSPLLKGSGVGKREQRDEQALGVPSPRTRSTQGQQPDRVEAIIDLVNTVDQLVKDLRVHVLSPSIPTEGIYLQDDTQNTLHDSKPCSVSSGGPDELTAVTSPRSGPAYLQRQQHQFSDAGSSGLGGSLDIGIPHHSILFSQSHGSNHSLGASTACKHCNGTGYSLDDDASIIDRTGLSQPNLVPFHSHNVTQDPRSPLSSSKKSRLSMSPVFGRPSPTYAPVTLNAKQSPQITSADRRG